MQAVSRRNDLEPRLYQRKLTSTICGPFACAGGNNCRRKLIFRRVGGKGAICSVAAAARGTRRHAYRAVGPDGKWAVERLLENMVSRSSISAVIDTATTANRN